MNLTLRERWESSIPALVISGDLTVWQVVEGWWTRLMCRVVGHKWEPDYFDYPEANYLQGHFCERCWKYDPYRSTSDVGDDN